MPNTFIEKHAYATDINTEEGIERTSQLENQRRIFGIDAEGNTITDNDTVEILTHPYTGKRGVAVGSNEYGKCTVDWWNPKNKKFEKTTFITDQLKKTK